MVSFQHPPSQADAASTMDNEILAAVKKSDIKSVKTILSDSESTIHSKNADGETCLHLAMKWSNNEMVKLLISNGADLAIQNETTRNTPLHDLVEKTASDDSNTDKFNSIWQIVVDKAVD